MILWVDNNSGILFLKNIPTEIEILSGFSAMTKIVEGCSELDGN